MGRQRVTRKQEVQTETLLHMKNCHPRVGTQGKTQTPNITQDPINNSGGVNSIGSRDFQDRSLSDMMGGRSQIYEHQAASFYEVDPSTSIYEVNPSTSIYQPASAAEIGLYSQSDLPTASYQATGYAQENTLQNYQSMSVHEATGDGYPRNELGKTKANPPPVKPSKFQQ